MEVSYARTLEKNAEANWSNLVRGFKTPETSADRLKTRLTTEYEDRCFWKGLMGMVGSSSCPPPSALDCAAADLAEGGGKAHKDKVHGCTNDIADWKF
ncbi:hypothetical protein TrRE_jg5595 [Triparma retinervis]|uniref:Uncharacterized protein n=1 Tax=Triparma retinervis TaxID=2557542 RepID=A0A9W7FX50_9STRA|nr:hypothetical protein TrRE_jg5595 [Triparma retinervis]